MKESIKKNSNSFVNLKQKEYLLKVAFQEYVDAYIKFQYEENNKYKK